MSSSNDDVVIVSECISETSSAVAVPLSPENFSNEKKLNFDRRSSVWDHYILVEEEKNGVKAQYAKCKHCWVKYRRDGKARGSTGNMNTHLKQHPFIVMKSSRQPEIGSALHSANNSKIVFSQDGFRKLLIKWIVKKNQPFSEAESPEFVQMIQSLRHDAHSYSNDTVRKDVMKAFDEEKCNIKSILEEIPGKLSFTHDGYTTPNRISFLGIGCHWISKDWTLCNALIDLVHVKEEHSGLNLSKAFVSTLSSFDISPSKILGITMDNARNNDTFMTELRDLLKEDGIAVDSRGNRVRCMAHILNLAVQDFLITLKCSPPEKVESYNDSNEKCADSELSNTAPGLVKKVRLLVKKIHLSTQKSEKLAEFCKLHGMSPLKLILDVSTRWNSTFLMLSRAEELKTPLLSLCSSDKDLQHLILHENDWLELNGLKQLLKKFENATKMVSFESKPTITTYVPTVDFLQKSLQDFILLNSGNLKTAAEKALLKLNEYEPNFDKSSLPFFAIVLDPTLKLQYFKDHMWDKKFIVKIKTSIVSKFKSEYQKQTQETPVEKDSTSTDTAEQDYLEFLIKRPRQDTRLSEIEMYLKKPPENSKTSVLDWWKAHENEFPDLSAMARDYLAVKGSSVFMEREFSNGADLVVPTRCRLNCESITKCMCLRYWWNFQNK